MDSLNLVQVSVISNEFDITSWQLWSSVQFCPPHNCSEHITHDLPAGKFPGLSKTCAVALIAF